MKAWAALAFLFACGNNKVIDDDGGIDGDGRPTHGDVSLGCKLEPPPGATVAAAPKPYSGGTCPTLPTTTTQDIVIKSSGNDRMFWLVVPENYDPNEELPVLFLWHWLGASPQSFFDKGQVQFAATEQRFLAVIPQAKGDLQFTWPATLLDNAMRMEEEAKFFDDMLSCVSAQFKVDPNCVSSTGVSAGALWTDQLIGMRGDWLANFMSLSGGTGGSYIKPFVAPAHKLPGLVLWGGATDSCGGFVKFDMISADLEMNMKTGGQFTLECIHNCGHSVPPFEGPMESVFRAMWQFALDHPFWLYPGESPYTKTMPADLPDWCGIGMGGATPRTAACVDSSAC